MDFRWEKRREGTVFLPVKKCPRKAFTHLSEAQLWPAQWGARILVRHEALNRRAHAVSSQPALMALPERTKAEDRSQPLSILIRWCGFYLSPVLLLLQLLHVQNELEIPPHAPRLSFPPSSPLTCRIPPLFFPSSPSVHHRWKWCMTRVASTLSRGSRKLIMTGSILLCQHHTPFVSLLVGAPRVWQVCLRELELLTLPPLVRERERERKERARDGGGTIVSA